MTRPADPPAWLEGFQARFSSVLRTPLDGSARTLLDQRGAFDAEACADATPQGQRSAREQLAVYNRQYWFRLLTALQHELPLSHRLLGSWTFNGLALRFLEAHAPTMRDLARAADGFASALAELALQDELERPGMHALPYRALVQAAQIDEAYRAILRAPAQPAFTPTAAEASSMLEARLVVSPAMKLIAEDWPLVALRGTSRNGGDERPEPLPPPHAAPQHWALCASATGYRALPLAPLQAELLALLEQHSIAEALGMLERAHGDAPELPALVQSWLAAGMRLGFWTGLAR